MSAIEKKTFPIHSWQTRFCCCRGKKPHSKPQGFWAMHSWWTNPYCFAQSSCCILLSFVGVHVGFTETNRLLDVYIVSEMCTKETYSLCFNDLLTKCCFLYIYHTIATMVALFFQLQPHRCTLVFQCKKLPCLQTQSPRFLVGACVVLSNDPDDPGCVGLLS